MKICPECGETYEPGAGHCDRDGARLVERVDPLLGQTLGSWRVTRLLGAGGMGRVYLGVQPTIGSRVAIKVLSIEAAHERDLVERFFAEARAVNLIRHDGIVNVLDLAYLADGRPYIVMEHLEGETLGQVLDRRGALPLGTLAQIVGGVLEALEAAHRKGIVHRDLKPDNVFVLKNGRVKVLDFGIAKLAAQDVGSRSGPTQSGVLLGTPHYMSPEQARSAPVDARTDVYAAGVMLYEGATGSRPFRADSLYELLRQHVETPPPPPREKRPDLSPAFEAVILRALEKDPARRFPTARDMGAALSTAAAALTPAAFTPVVLRASAPAIAQTPSQQTDEPLATTEDRTRWWPLAVIAAAVALFAAGLTYWLYPSTRTASAPTPPPESAPAPAPAPEPAPAPSPSPSPVVASKAEAKPQPRRVSSPAPSPSPTPSPASGVTLIQTGTKGFTRPADYDPRRFDAVSYLPRAERFARQLAPDARLVRFDIPAVYPDGHADLTLVEDGEAEFWFRSPSLSKRDPSLPIGVDRDIRCMIYVEASPKGVEVYWASREDCAKEPFRPMPKCTLPAIWKRASGRGAPAKAVAKIGYIFDGWYVDIDAVGFYESFKDDC